MIADSPSPVSDCPSAAAALISGGVDSAVLAVELLRDHERVFPLYIRGGLQWEETELAAARAFVQAVRRQGLEDVVVLDEPVADIYGAHWSTGAGRVPDAASPDEAVYLPGRNLLLVVKASVWCRLRGIGALAIGCLGSSPFSDSTAVFFKSLESVLAQALSGAPRLLRPFDGQSKRDVILRGKHLPLHLTFSCINPVHGFHCGGCNKCAERRKGFWDAGVTDLTAYLGTDDGAMRLPGVPAGTPSFEE